MGKSVSVGDTLYRLLDYYTLFIAFSGQQWLREHASILRCTYMACLGYLKIPSSIFMFLNKPVILV